MENEEILEPLAEYNNKYRQKSIDEANKYFDELVEKAKFNQDENAKTADSYYSKYKEYEEANKKANNSKGLKIFLIIMAVIFFILAVFMFVIGFSKSSGSKVIFYILGPVFAILGIVDIVMICSKLNQLIKKEKLLLANC